MIQGIKTKSTLATERIIIVDPSNGTATYGAGAVTGASYFPLGITIDGADTNQPIPFKTAGEIARLVFNDTITAGAQFTSDANGKGVPFASGVTGTSWACGIALETVISTGSVADVFIHPTESITI